MYIQKNLTTDLIGYFPFDGNTNNLFKKDTITQNNITYTTGKVNQAAVFNGTNSYLSFENPFFSTLIGSVSLWAYHNDYDDFSRPFSDGGGYTYFEQNTFPTNRLYFWVYTGLGESVSSTYNLNEWTHWVATWGNNTLKLYKNGVLVDTNDNVVLVINSSYNTYIGQNGIGTGYFNGMLDEVAYWNRTLSLYDVQQLYNSGSGRSLI